VADLDVATLSQKDIYQDLMKANGKKRLVVPRILDVLIGSLLFIATAAIVWLQNTRLTVLYDLAGVLEPATRMAQGDVPYRDFPFAYAPLTFLIQSTLIKLTGAVYWHHVIYACVVAGLATVLAWRVIFAVIDGALPRSRLTAVLLSLPAVVLGVYCVFPHPFYDPDAAFVILLCLWLLLCLKRRDFPPVPTVVTGVIVVIPLFIKQNIGLSFLASVGIWLLIRVVAGIWKKWAVRGHLLLSLGIFIGLSIGLAVIQLSCSIETYKYWTWDFATARRAPSLADMLAVYADPWLIVWLALFLLGAFLYRKLAAGKGWETALASLAMAAPFLWPTIFLVIDGDASERAERLIGLWPFVMITLALCAYGFTRRVAGIAAALPLVLIATAHGVFLSQQLWGSTYGIWPLLMIMIALLLRQLHDPAGNRSGIAVTTLAAAISLSICTAGAYYIYSNERLNYVSWDDGEMAHSSLPQLAGMSMRGNYLPDFDELVAWTDANIPRDDGILNLPGEDLFYYTTGRKPHFSVLLFDVSNNPYNVDEIRQRVEASDIEWMIVKNDLEIEADDMIDSKDRIADALDPDFRHVVSLKNYEVFRRRHPGDPPDEESDDTDDTGDEDTGD
jgi:hypothetical protein